MERRRKSARSRLAVAGAAAASILALAACGEDEPRQDVDEPAGEFPVDVFKAKFPNRQRLAETNDLVLGVENSGEATIPDLAVTVFVADEAGEPAASGQPFYTRIEQAGVANPNRPVWILENTYPHVEGLPAPEGSSPGTVAQTNTFGFGELPPGERIEVSWRLTAVRAGTYTIDYEVSAGLQGKARAVTADGSPPEGKFVVTISDKPPKATVTGSGKVKIEE